MVKYVASDLIDFKDFGFAWRFTDVHVSITSDKCLEHLRFLSVHRSQIVRVQSEAFRNQGPFTLKTEHYHACQTTSIEENNPDDTLRIQKWFTDLPINSAEEVYVSWFNVKPSGAVITTWGAFIEFWTDLWYPFDALNVFDETLNWAVLLGREECAVYAEYGAMNNYGS